MRSESWIETLHNSIRDNPIESVVSPITKRTYHQGRPETGKSPSTHQDLPSEQVVESVTQDTSCPEIVSELEGEGLVESRTNESSSCRSSGCAKRRLTNRRRFPFCPLVDSRNLVVHTWDPSRLTGDLTFSPRSTRIEATEARMIQRSSSRVAVPNSPWNSKPHLEHLTMPGNRRPVPREMIQELAR